LPDGESRKVLREGVDFQEGINGAELICPSRLGKNSAFSAIDVRFDS